MAEKNLIGKFRKAHGMTQRELGQAIGTSQQQIQRMEAGTQSVRLDLAAAICSVFGEPMQAVFPGLRTKAPKTLGDFQDDELEDAGIDKDFSLHTLRVQLVSGEMLFFPVSEKAERHIKTCFLHGDRNSFAVFDSLTERVAINLSRVAFAQFLFDPGMVEPNPEHQPSGLVFHIIGMEEPLFFDVDADECDDEDDDDGNIAQIFSTLDMVDGDFIDAIQFFDVDGEDAWVHSSRIAVCRAELSLVSPALRDAECEGFEEDEELDEDEGIDPEVAAAMREALAGVVAARTGRTPEDFALHQATISDASGMILVGDLTSLHAIHVAVHLAARQLPDDLMSKQGFLADFEDDLRRALEGRCLAISGADYGRPDKRLFGVGVEWLDVLFRATLMSAAVAQGHGDDLESDVLRELEKVIAQGLEQAFGEKACDIIDAWRKIDPSQLDPNVVHCARGLYSSWTAEDRKKGLADLLRVFHDDWKSKGRGLVTMAKLAAWEGKEVPSLLTNLYGQA